MTILVASRSSAHAWTARYVGRFVVARDAAVGSLGQGSHAPVHPHDGVWPRSPSRCPPSSRTGWPSRTSSEQHLITAEGVAKLSHSVEAMPELCLTPSCIPFRIE